MACTITVTPVRLSPRARTDDDGQLGAGLMREGARTCPSYFVWPHFGRDLPEPVENAVEKIVVKRRSS